MAFICTASLLITVAGWLEGNSPAQAPSTSPVLIAIISGLVAGSGATILNYLLTRRKTKADIDKTIAETEKIRAELNTLKTTVSSLANPNEDILFDGTSGVTGFDFRGHQSTLFDKNGQPTGPMALGQLTIETGGILNVVRQNTDGRFEIHLQRYMYKGKEEQVIPPDVLISGKRKLRAALEAKASGGEHVLGLVIANPETYKWLADDQRISVKSNQWTAFQAWFAVDPNQPAQLRINNRDVSHAPSSVQIRNLVLAQQK